MREIATRFFQGACPSLRGVKYALQNASSVTKPLCGGAFFAVALTVLILASAWAIHQWAAFRPALRQLRTGYISTDTVLVGDSLAAYAPYQIPRYGFVAHLTKNVREKLPDVSELPNPPQTVVVLCGTNDILLAGYPRQRVEAELSKLVAVIRAKWQPQKVVVVSPYQTHEIAQQSEYAYGDGIHLNEKGYAFLASEVPALAEIYHHHPSEN